jgi:hypothetical protein
LAVKFMTSSTRQLARIAPRILLSSKESMSNSAPSPKAYDEAGYSGPYLQIRAPDQRVGTTPSGTQAR